MGRVPRGRRVLSYQAPFFGELYRETTRPFLTDAMTRAEVAYLREHLSDAPAGPVLDLGCGHGRHLKGLALDGTVTWLGIDRDEAGLQEVLARCPAVLGDLASLPFQTGSLGACFAWYSTLSLFEDDDLARVLASVRRVLRPGGLLITQGVPKAHAAGRAAEVFRQTLPDGRRLEDECSWDPTTRRDKGRRTLFRTDGTVLSAEYFVRCFEPEEWTERLERAGFAPRWVHGGVVETQFTPRSRELIVGAQRD